MKILYRAEVRATGGREGKVISSDEALSLPLSIPKELGGPGGNATNPEQLFAAGYSACFESAIRHIARQKKVPVQDLSVTAIVGIGALESGGFGLEADLKIHLPGMDQAQAWSLIEDAHRICPYSNATRNNLNVRLGLVAE